MSKLTTYIEGCQWIQTYCAEIVTSKHSTVNKQVVDKGLNVLFYSICRSKIQHHGSWFRCIGSLTYFFQKVAPHLWLLAASITKVNLMTCGRLVIQIKTLCSGPGQSSLEYRETTGGEK